MVWKVNQDKLQKEIDMQSYNSRVNKDNLDKVKALVIEACDKVMSVNTDPSFDIVKKAVLRYKMSMVRGINQIQEARKEKNELLLDLGIDIVWSDNPIFTPSKHNSENKSELRGIRDDLKAALRTASVELNAVELHEPSIIPNCMADSYIDERIKSTARELGIKSNRLEKKLFPMGGERQTSLSLAWYGN